MNVYLDLFWTFFKMGAVTFGGGYAMLPMLETEIVEKRNWATKDEIMNYYAVGQCTPGIIAVNVATFIGYNQKGILGGIVSTLGMVSPSLFIITFIAAFIHNFQDLAIVQHALNGLRVGVCAIVLNSVWKLAKSGIKDVFGIVVFLVAFLISLLLDISAIWLTLAAMIAGLAKMKLGGKK